MKTAERIRLMTPVFTGLRGARQVRNGLTLVLDSDPRLIRRDNEVIGYDAMVRLFDSHDHEVRIDPHRICINPPMKTGKNRPHDPVAAYWEWLWGTISTAPNPKGWRTKGTVTTVFATAPGGNGTVRSTNATYATARTGGTLQAVGRHVAGQQTGFICYEAFIDFDTSGIPDTDVVSGVVLSLFGNSDSSTTDFTATAAINDFGGGAPTTADWISGASLAGLTAVATFASSGYTGSYDAFTDNGSFPANLNKTGATRLIVFSDRHSAGTTPTGNEFVTWEDADAASTTNDPKLDITHAAPATVSNIIGTGVVPV